MMRVPSRGGLNLCGLGVDPPGETTLEALRTLEESDRVFTDVQDKSLLDWLRGYVPRLVVLKGRAPAQRILREARVRRVSVAVWGHPFLSSRLCLELAAGGARRRIPLFVPGAISPAGSAFAKAKAFFGGAYGAANEGIQIYELETACAQNGSVEAGLPLVVYGHEEARPRQWALLLRRLRELHPPGHTCFFFSDNAAGEPARAIPLSAAASLAVERRGLLLVLPVAGAARAARP